MHADPPQSASPSGAQREPACEYGCRPGAVRFGCPRHGAGGRGFPAALAASPEGADAPETLLEERYWCGCVRYARWDRCERHCDLDHDDEPLTRAMEEGADTPAEGERVVPYGTLATALNLLSTFRDHIEIGDAEVLHRTGEEIDAFLTSLATPATDAALRDERGLLVVLEGVAQLLEDAYPEGAAARFVREAADRIAALESEVRRWVYQHEVDADEIAALKDEHKRAIPSPKTTYGVD